MKLEAIMADSRLLEKILFINKHKQERLSAVLAKLNAEQAEVALKIQQNQQNIDALGQQIVSYKQNAYQEKLTNTKIGVIEVRKINYDMDQLRLDLENAHKYQTSLSEEYKNFDNLIAAEQAKIKALLIKEAKFEHIMDSYVA